jgi:hypothetical protein
MINTQKLQKQKKICFTGSFISMTSLITKNQIIRNEILVASAMGTTIDSFGK